MYNYLYTMEKSFIKEIEFICNKNEVGISQHEECIILSNKLVELFKIKAREYNEINSSKMHLQKILNVFCSAAEDFSERANSSKTMNEWCLARVHGFLRIFSSKSIKFSSKRSLIGKEIDLTKNWAPSEEDFSSAQVDIEIYNLKYNFNDVDELYLKRDYSKYWFEV